MTAVVTGANGFLGRYLVEELLSLGNHVIAIVKNKSKVPNEWKENSLVECIEYSKNAFPEITADIFFHFAWSGTAGVDRGNVALQLENVQLSCDAVLLAKKMGCKRFVHAGSIMEYEMTESFTRETFIPSKANIYSIGKLASDYMAKTIAVAEGIEYVNVIISNVYGVGEKSPRFVNTVVKKMLCNDEIPLTGCTQPYDFIYVTDAAKAIILVGEKGVHLGNYYIGNSTQISLKEYVQMMYEVTESNSKLMFGQINMATDVFDYKLLDTERIERELGFQPQVTFKDGIKRLSEWLKLENVYV